MAIIGLDLSTSICGICILNDDGTYSSVGYLELKKEKNLYRKADLFKKFLLEKTKGYDNIKFIVEAPLLMFKMRASMASTIALLNKWNAVCCFQIYSIFGQEPTMVNVNTARKTIGLFLPKKKKRAEIKPMVFQYVKSLKIVPESVWVYKKTGRPKDWVYDICDATVVALSGKILLSQAKV